MQIFLMVSLFASLHKQHCSGSAALTRIKNRLKCTALENLFFGGGWSHIPSMNVCWNERLKMWAITAHFQIWGVQFGPWWSTNRISAWEAIDNLLRENIWNFVTLLLLSPWNDTQEMSAEISYWCHITTQIWIVL